MGNINLPVDHQLIELYSSNRSTTFPNNFDRPDVARQRTMTFRESALIALAALRAPAIRSSRGQTPWSCLSVLLVTLVALFNGIAPCARAAAIDSLTATVSGANTEFAITGIFPSSTLATPYSSPNSPYSLTFALPTTPSSLAFVDVPDEIFGIDTTVTLDGVNFADSQIAFFVASQGGGLAVCLSDVCSPEPPTSFPRWVLYGDQLYTGSLSSPTFISGTANIDSDQSFIETPTPEPVSLVLAGIGVAAAMVSAARRRQLE